MDFSDTREKIAAMPARFWAGVPNVPAKKKESMAIYTCFIQHVINSLKKTGKGAIVIPTGFITAKSGIENKILKKIVEDKIGLRLCFLCQVMCLQIQDQCQCTVL